MAVTLLWVAALVLIAWAGATGRGVRDTRDPDYTMRPSAPRPCRGTSAATCSPAVGGRLSGDAAVIAIRRTPVEHTSAAVAE
ncbi:hypothetical protein OG948_50340 (plasmid) [Embleya sp. NBC_00888]|uniref:hypothetical protein n=1 Tax=Embleya sp. NBC_00888 TaxID=2975960 RepID=UPI002F917F70|nr:hypothetical protein OG948_50340 [Embleya sp. NBC_00888]